VLVISGVTSLVCAIYIYGNLGFQGITLPRDGSITLGAEDKFLHAVAAEGKENCEEKSVHFEDSGIYMHPS